MGSYSVTLLETRISPDDTDDVALFDVVCEQDERRWRVPIVLSPLFRLLHMGSQPSAASRKDMVAGLGVRAISEGLKRGEFPDDDGEPLVLAATYPGAPEDPDPLQPYDRSTVRVP